MYGFIPATSFPPVRALLFDPKTLDPELSGGTVAARCHDVKRLDIKRFEVNTFDMETTTLPPVDEQDRLDERLRIWKREIPNLDVPTEGIVERIQVLARYFDRSMDDTLAEFELDRRAYWLIGNLRYSGPPYRRTPGELAESMHVSSGAMTNRLDRVEALGLIRRLPDPNDRRGTLVEPTEAGHAAWERCVGVQAAREALIASALSDTEKELLHTVLRRLMRAFPPEYEHSKKHHADAEE
jgi:DNA-binding MarR family transcriptional regulator